MFNFNDSASFESKSQSEASASSNYSDNEDLDDFEKYGPESKKNKVEFRKGGGK